MQFIKFNYEKHDILCYIIYCSHICLLFSNVKFIIVPLYKITLIEDRLLSSKNLMICKK